MEDETIETEEVVVDVTVTGRSYTDIMKEAALKAVITVVVTAIAGKLLKSAGERIQRRNAELAEEIEEMSDELNK